jgi:preprotein translocase subunit SecA
LTEEEVLDEAKLRERIVTALQELYRNKEEQVSAPVMRQFEKAMMLQTLDTCWREHLAAMDYLRQGIHLRGYAQKNPKQEYKRESFELFAQLLDKVNYQLISTLCKFEVKEESDVEELESRRRQAFNSQNVQYKHVELDALNTSNDTAVLEDEREFAASDTVTRMSPKVGRNDPCPCGSGQKYKQCHGKLV